jgi:hypothetical protein
MMNLLKLSKNNFISNFNLQQKSRNLASFGNFFNKKDKKENKKKDEFDNSDVFNDEVSIGNNQEIMSEFASLKDRR